MKRGGISVPDGETEARLNLEKPKSSIVMSAITINRFLFIFNIPILPNTCLV